MRQPPFRSAIPRFAKLSCSVAVCTHNSVSEAPNPNPVITHALNNLGMIYMLTGKDDEAIHYFQQVYSPLVCNVAAPLLDKA